MIAGLLQKQLPKPSVAQHGVLTCQNALMRWWDDPTTTTGKIISELENPEILSASTHGVHFRGFEPSGTDKSGRKIMKYQEWWITPAIKGGLS